jgi:hypothetical protein
MPLIPQSEQQPANVIKVPAQTPPPPEQVQQAQQSVKELVQEMKEQVPEKSNPLATQVQTQEQQETEPVADREMTGVEIWERLTKTQQLEIQLLLARQDKNFTAGSTVKPKAVWDYGVQHKVETKKVQDPKTGQIKEVITSTPTAEPWVPQHPTQEEI